VVPLAVGADTLLVGRADPFDEVRWEVTDLLGLL